MKSFKEFFNESIESEADLPEPPAPFNVPPPRAEFQRGDVVLVQNPQPDKEDYLTNNLPKYMHGYTNAVGRIIGHRPMGISTQFAVEFEDKTIGKLKGYWLVGPFRSIQTAKKYQGRKELVDADIAPEDHKRYAEARSEIGANEAIENGFKKLFVEGGYFEWLPEPVVLKVAGKHKAVVLAVSKDSIPDEQGGKHHGIWEGIPQIANKAFFCKAIDAVSSQLIKTSTIVDLGSGYYGLMTPNMDRAGLNSTFHNGKIAEIGFYYNKRPVNSVKALVEYKAAFERITVLKTIEDGMELFDAINNVQVKGNLKIVPKEAHYFDPHIAEGITTDINAFKNYVAEGRIKCSCNINGQIVFPKEVKGKCLTIQSSEDIENLKGFPITSPGFELIISSKLNSFEGLPSTFDGSIHVYSASSLKGFPKVVKGNCGFDNIDSFEGGQDSVIEGALNLRTSDLPSFSSIPEATVYRTNGVNWQEENTRIKSIVKKRKIVDKELSKEFDVSALDDF